MRSSIHASLLIATCAIVGAAAISLPSCGVVESEVGRLTNSFN